MTAISEAGKTDASVMIVDGDIVSRHAIADYLRHCGYAVVEAANTDESMNALAEEALRVEIILCDVAAIGARSAFEFASWVRAHRPALEVRLAGNLDAVVRTAADLCETGPHLRRPYEPEAVTDYIRQLRARRDRTSTEPKP